MMALMDRFLLDESIIHERKHFEAHSHATNSSLQLAIRPLLSPFPNLSEQLDEAHQLYKNSPQTLLQRDEFASIYLHTVKCGQYTLGHQMRKDLCSQDVDNHRKWLAFESILKAAIEKLPDTDGEYWCYTTDTIFKKMVSDKKIILNSYVWAASSLDYLKLSSQKSYYTCCMKMLRVKKIARLTENSNLEFLLTTGSCLVYKSQSKMKNNHIVHLEQIKLIPQNYETSSTGNPARGIERVVKKEPMYREEVSISVVHPNFDPKIEENRMDSDRKYSITTMENGDTYEVLFTQDGQYKSSTLLKEGNAVFRNSEAKSKVTGRGTANWSNGDKFSGRFIQGEMEGYGQLHCANGYTYEGDWKRSKPHGEGKSEWTNGDTHEGIYTYGKITGKGSMISKNGKNRYEGQLIDGKAHGQGSRTWEDGSRYYGEFLNNKKHGSGKYIDFEGVKYEGQWENDMMHGDGSLEWPSGVKFVGKFRNDKQIGKGKYTFPDSRHVEGTFIDGKFNPKQI